MDTNEAYRECERITWSQARNFAYGIRLLPPPKRRALAAVYAFARRIDDIGDGDLPAEDKAAALETAREQVLALVAGASSRIPDAYHSRARAASNSTRPANLARCASVGNGSGWPGVISQPNFARSSAGR